MTSEEKVEFVAGQVHALIGVVHALILSHHNLPMLARAVEINAQASLATAESTLVDDHYVEGVQDVWERVQKALEIAKGLREAPKAQD